ncbi:MAG: stage III sporulation protein AE [Clostridia bacterium]|nr:stage III sporulation protein AE [Clostridia bacterium]
MKRALLMVLLFLTALCVPARGENLQDALESTLSSLPLSEWQRAYDDLAPAGESLTDWVLRLARGEAAVDGETLLRTLGRQLLSALSGSLWRLSRLLAPAIFCGVLARMRSAFARANVGEAVHAACFLMLAGVMAADLGDHMALAQAAVSRMADLMQSLFPLLLTLLAAVGGTAASAFFQPAVVAACGTMTALVRTVTLPLSLAAGVAAILNHLSDRMRIGRLAGFFRSAAAWVLGVAFTVFMSVTTLQSLGTAAADGISLRTAKYAVDNLVPVVGGMFADTMDTLVGASLLIKNALGLTGLMLLLSLAAVPLIQTLAAVILYRVGAALLDVVADPRVSRCMQDFSDVLMLLFIIQLSVGAMFLLLVAQMLVVGNLTVMLR